MVINIHEPILKKILILTKNMILWGIKPLIIRIFASFKLVLRHLIHGSSLNHGNSEKCIIFLMMSPELRNMLNVSTLKS